jgi:hypothetical protein
MQIQKLNINEEDFEYEHQRQIIKRRSKDQSQHQTENNWTSE